MGALLAPCYLGWQQHAERHKIMPYRGVLLFDASFLTFGFGNRQLITLQQYHVNDGNLVLVTWFVLVIGNFDWLRR